VTTAFLYLRTFVAALALAMIVPLCSSAQWVRTNGPYGARVSVLTVASRADGTTDTTLYAGTGDGVFRSTNDGTSWSAASSGLPPGGINALAVSGTEIFAGKEGGGVFYSSNSGTSWTDVSDDVIPRGIGALAFCGPHIIAATGKGVFLSANKGAPWTPTLSGDSKYYFRTLAVSGTHVFVANYNGDIFHSTDEGRSWTLARAGSPNITATALVASGTNIILGTQDQGILISHDYGTHWVAANTGLTRLSISALAVCGTEVFATVQASGVFSSTDTCATWHAIGTEGRVHTQFALAVSPSRNARGGRNIFTGYEGVFRTTDMGMSWTAVNTGLTNAYVSALAVADSRLVAGTSYGGLSFSADGGRHWTTADADLAGAEVFALAAVPVGGGTCGTHLYAGTSKGVFRSTDASEYWTLAAGGLANFSHVQTLAVLSSSGGTGSTDLFAGTWSGMFRFNHDGERWTGPVAGLLYQDIRSFAVSGSRLFAGTKRHGLFGSTDNGTSWTAANTGLPAYVDVLSLAVLPTSGGTCLVAGTSEGVVRSSDNGESWIPANTGLANFCICALAVLPRSDGTDSTDLFAGTWNGIYHSSDNGSRWTAVSTGLPAWSVVYALAFQGTDLFAGLNGTGVWRRPLSEMIKSTEGGGGERPQEFALFQNYPNPFNPNSDIRYQISEFRTVKLAVYDLLGHEVAVLVNENKAPGTYQVRFDGAGLPSGVYFYRMTAGSYSATKKLLLVR
jgi:photosystem II stability/assembly factor-like uncharacterized protein